MAENTPIDESDDTIICNGCGKDTPEHYYLCDERDGAWCPECFDKTPCGRGEHGEGCPTGVFSNG